MEGLDAVVPGVRASWHRAIRAEVARTTKAGRPRRSSYLQHKRPALYALLHDPAERRALAALVARARAWWFGVNNKPRGGHVQLDALRPWLSGKVPRFEWPVGHSKPKALYAEIRAGDRVLLWTGHGRDASWGVLGTGAILEVHDDGVVLGHGRAFSRPLTPYTKDQPRETEAVVFLRDCLGEELAPLGDVMHAVFGAKRRNPITIAEVPSGAFDAIVARAEGR